jgi:hypothetical protein
MRHRVKPARGDCIAVPASAPRCRHRSAATAGKFLLGSHSLMKTFKLLSCSVSTALLIGTLANADVVTDWNTAALDAIRAGHTAPPIASRSLAILHVSIYDAVNGIARTHEPYLVESAVPASASREAAASAAAHQALVDLLPASASSFDALHAAILAAIPDGPQKVAGIVWGEFVANQILAARATDASDAIVPPPSAAGFRLRHVTLNLFGVGPDNGAHEMAAAIVNVNLRNRVDQLSCRKEWL